MAGMCEAGTGGFASGWQAIDQKASGLFVDDSAMCKLEIFQLLSQPPSFRSQQTRCSQTEPQHLSITESRIVSTLDGLDEELKVLWSEGTSTVVLVHRANSWSRMKITLDMFKILCSKSGVDPSFATCIMGMGRKRSPNDEHFINSYSQIYYQQRSGTSKPPPVESFSE
ncbi:hypothetical protein MFIFM68171_07367 [Madurella fahalii]|uniref:CorA-like transporter domain-containing protein n=1 Tax=Madurella fahalii TaxID=1157608 RepID=A0ABQ0GHE4_9PEZI